MLDTALLLRYAFTICIFLNIAYLIPLTWSSDVTDKYPYVVTLEEQIRPWVPFKRTCAGALISNQFAISAANCFIYFPFLKWVRCGNMSLPKDKTTCASKITKIIPHPLHSFESKAWMNNIALVRTEKLVISSYGRLNFADYKTLTGRAVKYAGYGYASRQETIEEQLKSPLKIGEGVIFKDDDRTNRFHTRPQLLIASKCSKKNKYPFLGDFGGPLLVDGKIVGVACASGKVFKKHRIIYYPQYIAYTPISPFADWIREVIKKHDKIE